MRQELEITVDGQFATGVMLDRLADDGLEFVKVEKIDNSGSRD